MALSAAQKLLRAEIKKANLRLSRLQAAGIKSPAAERALSAIGQKNFNLGKNPTLSKEMAIKRAIQKFLKADTSTVSGYKKYLKKREKGAIEHFRDIGTAASDEQIATTLKGAETFAHYAEMYSISSDDVAIEFSRGANMGYTAADVESAMADKYAANSDIDYTEMDEAEDDYGF